VPLSRGCGSSRRRTIDMPMSSASIRIRPIRFGFLIDPQDRTVLRQVLRLNSCLWGGTYNYLLPVAKRTPLRYRDYSFTELPGGLIQLKLIKGTGPSAQDLVHGLLETFQPDFLVESKAGLSSQAPFDKNRVLTLEQFNEEKNGQRRYGIDLRSVCAALYQDAFRFVQRHPPKVIAPRTTDPKYGLLFAAAFGELPGTGTLAGCRDHYLQALDGKEEKVVPEALHEIFRPHTLYPLRVGAYRLVTHRRGWRPDPILFYMDESEPYDIIEYWNLRALGWRITPLPHGLASNLKTYCENYILEAHRPYAPPSNYSEDATFLCSRSCAFDEMQALVSSLKRPDSYRVSIDPRMPRIWEEWGRHADHAEPQMVEHETEQVDVFSLGNSISIATAVPEFVEDRSVAVHACTNVVENLPGSAPVVPWEMIDMKAIAREMHDENTWVSREGICTTSGAYRTTRILRLPSALNVFAAWAQKYKLTIELSPSGRLAEQLIDALGGVAGMRIVGQEDLINVLDRMANGTLEVDGPEAQDAASPRRRLRKASIPLYQLQQLLNRVNHKNSAIAQNHLSALLASKVLALGMEVPCTQCGHHTWFALGKLEITLKCERCLREFPFPLTAPHQNTWSYRVQGPFAVEDFAHGAYCVGTALHFLVNHVSRECTWIPSFALRSQNGGPIQSEADFAAFLRPSSFSDLSNPMLVLGECKTFGEFDSRDYRRMTGLAKSFPGAILCFCTLRAALTSSEKRRMAQLARQGRKSLKTGQRKNPVLVLTQTELLGQLKLGRFLEDYPAQFVKLAESVFLRHDLQEICDFTQQVHLGIEPFYEWIKTQHKPRPVKGVITTAPQASSSALTIPEP